MQSQDPYTKVDAEIAYINNKHLKALPVSLHREGGSLYALGTFPPKLGETQPKQRKVPLKLKAHIDNLKLARERITIIGADLIANRYKWAEPVDNNPQPLTVTDFVALHRAAYLEKNSGVDRTDTAFYWQKDFGYPFNKLPADKSPSIAICDRIIRSIDSSSRTRSRYVKAYSQLLRLAGIDSSEIDRLKGDYGTTQRQSRDIPSMDIIVEWFDRIPSQWQFFYSLLARFGLRGTEAHPDNCKLEDLHLGEIVVYGGKTKSWRYIPDCSEQLADAFNCPPQWYRLDRTPGQLSYAFEQMLKKRNCPFKPYDLRHHYAYFTLLEGWETALVAKYMGHSVDMHVRTYWEHIDRAKERELKSRRASARPSLDRTLDS